MCCIATNIRELRQYVVPMGASERLKHILTVQKIDAANLSEQLLNLDMDVEGCFRHDENLMITARNMIATWKAYQEILPNDIEHFSRLQIAMNTL